MSAVCCEDGTTAASRSRSSGTAGALGRPPLSQAQCAQAIGDSLLLLAAVHLRYYQEFNDPRPLSGNRRGRLRAWLARTFGVRLDG